MSFQLKQIKDFSVLNLPFQCHGFFPLLFGNVSQKVMSYRLGPQLVVLQGGGQTCRWRGSRKELGLLGATLDKDIGTQTSLSLFAPYSPQGEQPLPPCTPPGFAAPTVLKQGDLMAMD